MDSMPQPYIPGAHNRRKRRIKRKVAKATEGERDDDSGDVDEQQQAVDATSSLEGNFVQEPASGPAEADPDTGESPSLQQPAAPAVPVVPGRTRIRRRTPAQRSQAIRNRVKATGEDRLHYLNHTGQHLCMGDTLTVQVVDSHGDSSRPPFEIRFESEDSSRERVSWDAVQAALSERGYSGFVPMANATTPHDLHLPVPRLETLLIMSHADVKASEKAAAHLGSSSPDKPTLLHHYRLTMRFELYFQRWCLFTVLSLACLATLAPELLPRLQLPSFTVPGVGWLEVTLRPFDFPTDVWSLEWLLVAVQTLALLEAVSYAGFRALMFLFHERKIKAKVASGSQWVDRTMDATPYSWVAGFTDFALRAYAFVRRVLESLVAFLVAVATILGAQYAYVEIVAGSASSPLSIPLAQEP